jgi:hypothetical protein
MEVSDKGHHSTVKLVIGFGVILGQRTRMHTLSCLDTDLIYTV